MSLSLAHAKPVDDDPSLFEPLFELIANDVIDKGHSIRPYALPENLTSLLLQHITELPKENFKRAGIGLSLIHI